MANQAPYANVMKAIAKRVEEYCDLDSIVTSFLYELKRVGGVLLYFDYDLERGEFKISPLIKVEDDDVFDLETPISIVDALKNWADCDEELKEAARVLRDEMQRLINE